MYRVPDELVRVAPCFIENLLGCDGDPFTNLRGIPPVNGIERHHRGPPSCGFGIEAGRPVATAGDLQPKVHLRQREHAPVLIERPAPRNHAIQSEHRRFAVLPADLLPL
jgi:hypothetical protein